MLSSLTWLLWRVLSLRNCCRPEDTKYVFYFDAWLQCSCVCLSGTLPCNYEGWEDFPSNLSLYCPPYNFNDPLCISFILVLNGMRAGLYRREEEVCYGAILSEVTRAKVSSTFFVLTPIEHQLFEVFWTELWFCGMLVSVCCAILFACVIIW